MWVYISIDTVKAYLNAVTVNAANSLLLDANEFNRFDEIRPGIIARIRSEIASNPKNKLDPDESLIPESLKSEACALIIEAMQPSIMPLEEDQRRAADNARDYLKRISRGEVAVPGIVQTEEFQTPVGNPKISPKTLHFQRSNQDGL